MYKQAFLKNNVALVTGGSRGIGRAIVLMLSEQGCTVAFNYAKNEKAAIKLADQITETGGKVKAARVDIKDFAAVTRWVNQIKEEFGQLDILINNAGTISDKALFLMSQAEWDEVIRTNLDGLFHATRSCITTFLKQKKGQIINISSVSGINGLPGQTNYSASKGGMIAFTKALAKEVASYGIRVNAIAPGFIDTEMLSSLKEAQLKQFLQSVPLGRIGRAQEVANSVKFLLSEHATYITGQVIQIDGGLSMK